jgi:hypothetical protein
VDGKWATVASIKQRSRKDGSPYFDVMFRLDGRQRSVSFQTEKFRNLIELVGAAKEAAAREAGLKTPG